MSANKILLRVAGFYGLSVLAAVATVEARELHHTADHNQDRIHLDSTIYGSELMTERERNQYQKRLRDAKTSRERSSIMKQHRNELRDAKAAKEREQILQQYHKTMRKRARQEGVNLPD